MKMIGKIIEERNEYARKLLHKRVIVSSSAVEGEGIVTYIRYTYSFAEYPLMYVRLDDGRKVKVPSIAVEAVE